MQSHCGMGSMSLRCAGLRLTVAEVHAHEDEQGAGEEIEGDALGEDQPGKEYGGDGIEIDIVGDDDGSEFLDGPVPSQITEHGGYAAQKQQIGQDIGTQYQTQRRQIGPYEEVWDHGQQTVEKHLAGDEQRVVVPVGRYHQQRIERPTETGCKRQGIT